MNEKKKTREIKPNTIQMKRKGIFEKKKRRKECGKELRNDSQQQQQQYTK